MNKRENLLGDIAKRTGDLHQQLVKQTLFYLTVSVVLVVTLATAVTQLQQAGVTDLQERIQSQVNLAGETPEDDREWSLFDECGVAPFWVQPGQKAKNQSDREAAYVMAQQSLQALHVSCQTKHPFQLEIRLLDYPITIDLMIWGFVLPPGFLFVLAWTFRLRFERTLLVQAGSALGRGSPRQEMPLDAAMLFREIPGWEPLNRQATDWSERLLILALFGTAGFLFYRLWLLWAPLEKLLLTPLEKIYGLSAVMLLCVLIDCRRRLLNEIQLETGVVLGPDVGLRRIRSWIGRNWQSLCELSRGLPIRPTALVGGALGVLSLFLACGMEGCEDHPITGYQLLMPQWVTVSGRQGTAHQIVLRGSWYFANGLDSLASEIGRWSYAIGTALAVVAIVAVIVSLFRPGVGSAVLRDCTFHVLALSSFIYLSYELVWSDFLLYWWPVAAVAAAFSICFAWPVSRKRILGVLSRVVGERVDLYLAGFGVYTGVMALLGLNTAVVKRFWGIPAFFLGLALLSVASSVAGKRLEISRRKAEVIFENDFSPVGSTARTDAGVAT